MRLSEIQKERQLAEARLQRLKEQEEQEKGRINELPPFLRLTLLWTCEFADREDCDERSFYESTLTKFNFEEGREKPWEYPTHKAWLAKVEMFLIENRDLILEVLSKPLPGE